MKGKTKKQLIEEIESLLGEVAELEQEKTGRKRAEAGKPVDAIAVNRDITERKQAEEALRQSEERLRATFSSMEDLVFVLDEDGVFVDYYQPLIKPQLYAAPEEFLGKSFREILPPSVAEQLESAINAAVATNTTQQFDYCIESGGELKWYSGKISLRKNASGEFTGITTVARDITERKQAEQELESSRQQLRDLAARAESAREGERTRIARELHDEMGQTLTALKMDLSWLNKALSQDQIPLLEKTKTMTKLTDSAIQEVRRLATELRPGILDDLGLTAAIEWQAEEFQQRTEIECEVSLYPEDISLDQVLSTTIFRVLQETLTNVARHAQAAKVRISLQEKDGKLVLEVADNGRGITKKQISNPKSLGLLGMRERVLPWQGEVKISGIPGEGTTLTVNIPLGEKGEIS